MAIGLNPERLSRRALLGTCCALASPWALGQYRHGPWTGPDPVPWLEGTDLNGREWSLRRMTGQVIVLNFWATWCPPCVEELPSLQWLSENSPNDQVVLTVNVKEGGQKVQRFLQTLDLNLPTLLDRRGEWTRRLGIGSLPTTLLISSTGQTIQVVQGEVNWASAQAQAWIQALKAPLRTKT